MKERVFRSMIPLLVAAVCMLPLQTQLCLAAESGEVVILDDAGKTALEPVPETAEEIPVETPAAAEELPESVETNDSGLTTPMMIGIGVGAAVLVGGAIAIGSSSGGGESSTPAPVVPPTSDQLVSSWNADGVQPGSGLTYYGTYQLFQGGSLAYDLYVSDGEHLTGGGSWSLSEYTLTLHTDHGSKYIGDFEAGNITTVSLNSNTGWSLTLTR